MQIEYDTHYFENMLEMYAGSGQKVNLKRWEFISFIKPSLVLDYGCGCGMLKLFAPDGITVDSYDIGTIDGAMYPQTGIRHDKYDLICLFDVLEHVDWEQSSDPDMEHAISISEAVVVSVPMLPPDQSLDGWKHHKPGEHLTYFTKQSLHQFFQRRGFWMVKNGRPECPPRIDIYSAIFRKEKP